MQLKNSMKMPKGAITVKLTKGIYDRAFTNLVFNLQYALKDEWVESEEIKGDLKVLDELVLLSRPRKVIAERDGIGDSSIPYGSYDFYTFKCPNERCDAELDEETRPNYCPCCGQRLEWGEDE